MPKKKNKKDPYVDSENDDELDVMSTISHCSSESINSFLPTEYLDENAISDLLNKIENSTQDLTNARPDTRLTGLKNLIKSFQNVYLDLDSERHIGNSLLISVENILKKGSPAEQVLCCQLISTIAIQLGANQVYIWLKYYNSILDDIVADKTMSPKVRGAASVALSVLIWQCPDDLDVNRAKNTMENLSGTFRTACLKGDGKSPVHDEIICSMQENALLSWTRVLLSIPTSLASELGEAMVVHLYSILQNCNVNLRIASAQTLAIIFEHIRDERNQRYTGQYYRLIVSHLDELISESSKAVSKKDKKKQRTSLRPVLNSIRTQNHPEVTVKFGTEQITLDTCALNFFYESLCDILAHGINRHLQTNVYLRDMFDLGPPIKRVDLANQDRKESKAQRNYFNQVTSKNRCQARNLNRNKKSDLNCNTDQDY